MKPRELIQLLELEYPNQEVVLCATQSKRIMQILGINRAKSSELGAVVFDVDWSVTEGRVEESEIDKLKREKERLTKKIEKLTAEEKAQLATKVRKQTKSKRSKADKMIDEIIGQRPKGRTKKTQ